jgi:hypothetical protein
MSNTRPSLPPQVDPNLISAVVIPPSRRRRSRSNQSWKERPEIWYILAGLGLIVLAGGGTPVWARALVLLGAGAWICKRPPTETPSRIFDAAVLVLLGVALVSSFAPSAWFGWPSWRAGATELGVLLPKTNAPSPWLAAEAFAQLVAGLCWLYAWWSLRLEHEHRKWALWGLAGLTTLLAIGVILGSVFGVKYPLAQEARIFSYFPNRNQSALWFCIGGVVGFGMLLESMPRRKRVSAIIAGVMIVVCLIALIFSLSRMALALFSVGCVLVVVVRFGRDAGNYVLRLLVPLAIFGVSLLVFFERDTLERFYVFGGTGPEKEFRPELWLDTLGLANAQPAGAGLGQFEDVYPQYREHARTFQAVLHPDSDWFWLLGETGWAGVTAAAVAVGALLTVFLGREARASGPYRHLASLCAALFFVHSLVDVPAHRFGTWLLAAWLMALGAPERGLIRPLIPRLVFRLVGVALVAVGVVWLAAAAGMPWETTSWEDRAMASSEAAIAAGDPAAAIAATNAVMKVRPMRWWPYYQQARAELTLNDDQAGALADFRRARYLEPTWAGLPFQEGYLWAPYDPALAYAAWREAVQRDSEVPEGTWHSIAEALRGLPDGEDYLSNLSRTSPKFRYEYLMGAAPARFLTEWADELNLDPQLARYHDMPEQRQALLERWASLDGAAALAFLQSHPRAAAEGWLVELRALANIGKYREALALAQQRLPEVALPDFPNSDRYDGDSEADLTSMFHGNPQELDLAVALLKRQLATKEADKAMETLDLLMALKQPPPFVSWWRAKLLADTGKDTEAWAALQPYLEYERVMRLAPPAVPGPTNVTLPVPAVRRH